MSLKKYQFMIFICISYNSYLVLYKTYKKYQFSIFHDPIIFRWLVVKNCMDGQILKKHPIKIQLSEIYCKYVDKFLILNDS